jgi:hypothetical protein
MKEVEKTISWIGETDFVIQDHQLSLQEHARQYSKCY